MNYYILFCQTIKTEKVCKRLNEKEELFAYIPRMEKYIRSLDKIVDDIVMFPGYLFVESELDQLDFNTLLLKLDGKRDGIIKELRKVGVSSLRHDEIKLLDQLLDDKKILRMSVGYKKNNKTVVLDGPLTSFQDNIVDVDVKDRLAILNISVLNRNIKAGLYIKQNMDI